MGIAELLNVLVLGIPDDFDRYTLGFTLLAGFFFVVVLGVGFSQQLLAILDGDAVIIRMNFVERQKPVAIAAEIDEGRLERWLHAGHLGQIDVALDLTFGGGFVIVFEEFVTVCNDDPGFFRMGRVD